MKVAMSQFLSQPSLYVKHVSMSNLPLTITLHGQDSVELRPAGKDADQGLTDEQKALCELLNVPPNQFESTK